MSTWGQTLSINPPSNALVQDNSTIAINTLESTPYSIDGLSDSSTYRAYVQIKGTAVDSGARFSITSLSGLTLINSYPSFTNIQEVHFKGTPSNITAALNSITLNTGTIAREEITLEVYIGPDDVERRYFNPLNGHIYEYVPSGLSWSDARTNAKSTEKELGGETGYLVTITSEAEQAFISARTLISEKYWIGLSDEDEEGTFK